MIKNILRSKIKWPIGLFIFFVLLLLFLFFAKNQHLQEREIKEELRWEEVKTLIADEKYWATAPAREKSFKRLKELCEATTQPRELMNKLVETSIDGRYPGRLRALIAFARSTHIREEPQLKSEFKEKLLEAAKENRHKFEIVTPLDMIGGLSDWYRTPSPQEEKEVFLELLADPDAYPLGRSTAAFFLRNIQEPDLRDKVRIMAEELLVKYRELGLESRTIGRLHIAIRVLKPTSPLLPASWMRKIVDGIETEVLKGWEIKFARRLSMKELEEFTKKHNLSSYVVHEGSLVSETERLRSVPPGRLEEFTRLLEQIRLERNRQRLKGLVVARIESPDFLSERQVEGIRNNPLARTLIDYKRHRVIDVKEKDNL